MIELNQNKLSISAIYTLYCAGVLWFLNPLTLLGIKIHWLVLVLILVLIFALIFGTLTLAIKIKNRGLKQIVILLGFALTPTLSTVLSRIFTDTDYKATIEVTTTTLVAAIPLVAFVLLWIIYDDIKNKVQISSGEEESESTTVDRPIFKLTNEKGKTLIEVNLDLVICFEASDNYVVVYYLDESNEVQKSLQRISLKKVEEDLKNLDVLFKRIHKSYLINPSMIEKVAGKAQAYRVELKHLDKEVPVSRNFRISDITG